VTRGEAIRKNTHNRNVLAAQDGVDSRSRVRVLNHRGRDGRLTAHGRALAFFGGLPGLALAVVASLFLRESLANFVPGIAVTPGIALLGVALMLALGVLTGLAPALNAMRLKTAAALGRG